MTQVIERERPDALLATLGGQTALNLATALNEDGTLERFGVELIGASYDAIRRAEDRDRFRETMREAGCACRPRDRDAISRARWRSSSEIGLPAIVRPAFTLGGQGGGIARTPLTSSGSSRAGSPRRRSARCSSRSRCSAGASSSSR